MINPSRIRSFPKHVLWIITIVVLLPGLQALAIKLAEKLGFYNYLVGVIIHFFSIAFEHPAYPWVSGGLIGFTFGFYFAFFFKQQEYQADLSKDDSTYGPVGDEILVAYLEGFYDPDRTSRPLMRANRNIELIEDQPNGAIRIQFNTRVDQKTLYAKPSNSTPPFKILNKSSRRMTLKFTKKPQEFIVSFYAAELLEKKQNK